MSAEANKALVEQTWGAVTKGDTETFFNNLADDVTWTFFGTHKFAGTYHGKQELIDKLFTPLGDVLVDGIKITIDSITAEDDRVVFEARGEARSKAGAEYNNTYCIVVICANGKIQHAREYLDSELVTKVFGK